MRGDPLNRAAELRRDAAFLSEIRARPTTRLVPVWRERVLVEGRPARAVTPTVGQRPELLEAAEEVVFLGLDGDDAVLMVDLPGDREPDIPDGCVFLDLFRVGAQMPYEEMTLLAYARGMSHWHRNARFDPATGAPTRSGDGGFARLTEDGTRHFPRTDPAVMILVTHGDRVLLARQPRFPPGMLSALAGFVEPGESLEECVLRETLEEVGLPVGNLRYIESQPWPFPRSLMIGFEAEAEHDRVKLDEDELEEARWVSRDEVQRPRDFFTPPPFSLAYHLLRGWVERG